MMIWAEHVARMGVMEMHTQFWSENVKKRDHSEDLGVDGNIILEWFLRKEGGKVWTEGIWLRVRPHWRAFVKTVMNLRVP
jgi:hypothetical protein